MTTAVKKLVLILLVTMLAATSGLGQLGCSDDCVEGYTRCDDDICRKCCPVCCSDEDCEDGTTCCGDSMCHYCCSDEDCGTDWICVQDAGCCLPRDQKCTLRDRDNCCPGFTCDFFTSTCIPACAGDADCLGRGIAFEGDIKCQDGICDFSHCSTDVICAQDQVCYNGDCVTVPACDDIRECLVTPSSSVIRPDNMVQFTAAAYLEAGSLAPGFAFDWNSGDTGVVSIDDTGLAVGAAGAGVATVTATVAGCPAITCDASVTNYEEVSPGHTRVVTIDDEAHTPIQGATVVVGAEVPATTDARGVVEVPVMLSAGNPADVIVSKDGYSHVLFRAVESSDILVHVHKLEDPTRAGGVRGRFNFDRASCPHSCDVQIGFAGISIPERLEKLRPDLLTTDDVIKVQIELGGTQEEILLPTAMVMGLNGHWFKESFSPGGLPGNRVFWGLGGSTPLSIMIGAAPVSGSYMPLDEEAVYSGYWMRAMLDSFSYTDILPNVAIVPIPKVPDTDDINMNENTDELVPDYENYMTLPGGESVLKVPMDQEMTFVAPVLPVGVYDTVMVVAGVFVRGAGFVPLGGSVGTDVDPGPILSPDTRDGYIDHPIVVGVSELIGRIPEDQFRRVVLAMAFNEEDPTMHAVQITPVQSFTGESALPPFFKPADAQYDVAMKRVFAHDLPGGGDITQMIIEDEDGAIWNIFGEAETGVIDMNPAIADGSVVKKTTLISIDLDIGVSYQDLPAFNDSNLPNLVELTRNFSYTEVTVSQSPLCERWVLKGEAINARELGSHPLQEEGYTACEELYRGGDLSWLSESGCAEFAELGIQTVVDLREASVQQALPAATCVSDAAGVVSAAMPRLLPDTPENYLALLDETSAIATVFATLGDPAAYPVYILCEIGRARASLASALVLLALGAERQTIIDEFLLSEDAGITVKQECIEAVIDEIDVRGGIEAYLTSVGVTAAQLQILKEQVSTSR